MNTESLGDNSYKITLDSSETAEMPAISDKSGMHSFICRMIEQLEDEDIRLPEGELLAEMFLCSDGSCVFFITTPEHNDLSAEPQYYCCDIKGTDTLISLCTMLAHQDIRCNIYCGSNAEEYRLIFADPEPYVCHICAEYGEFSEITRLFACQTAEYLNDVSRCTGTAFPNY